MIKRNAQYIVAASEATTIEEIARKLNLKKENLS